MNRIQGGAFVFYHVVFWLTEAGFETAAPSSDIHTCSPVQRLTSGKTASEKLGQERAVSGTFTQEQAGHVQQL